MANFAEFMRDEDHGSVTIWSLLWFTGFCAIMGLAVDTTAAMNTEAKLQHVSDASAHAGVIEIFPIPQDAIAAAVTYSGYNITTNNVVFNSDVIPGEWDPATRTFNDDPNTIDDYNAVKVFATRDAARDNALLTSFLRVVGFYNWDIGTASIAHYTEDLELVNNCRLNGLLAGGLMEQTANNTLSRNICVHGEEAFKMTSNNVVTCGVELSLGPNGNYVTGTEPTYKESLGDCDDNYADLTNYEMMDQSFMYRSLRSNAEAEFDIIERVLLAYMNDPENPNLTDPLNLLPSYIIRSAANVQTMSVNAFNNAARVTGNNIYSPLTPGTMYHVECNGSNKKLVLEGIVRNIGIYTDCEIDVQKNKRISDLKTIKDKSGTHAIVDCDPFTEECLGDDWTLLLEPLMSCSENLATMITTETNSPLYGEYPESYMALDDTVGAAYRDGTMDPDGDNPCGIEPGATGVFDNVFIFTTANKDGNRNQTSITFPNNFQIGRIDGCTQGGSVHMYLGGSLHTPSSTVMQGTQIMALGDVFLAAKATGVNGIVVDSANHIKYAAQGEMGGCSPLEEDGESDVKIAVRPIAIVD